MRSLELFSGVGGLALGISRAGFEHEAVVEWDREACNTIRENQRRCVIPVVHWPLYHMDVRQFDYRSIKSGIDLLAGGPPCQPFSLGGKHRGQNDERNMFPETIRAVRELKPRAVLIENVKGLLRESFAKYFGYILLQLQYPDIVQAGGESWEDHLSRLEEYHTWGRGSGLAYKVVFQLLNAANYGVPQRRERVIIVAIRSDLGVEWSFPSATHSHEALMWDQWVTGDYWDRHKVASTDRPAPPGRARPSIERMRCSIIPPVDSPWTTVRDAISDLPSPGTAACLTGVPNHRLNPGARAYAGHTGSPLDEPAKTLKAGDHGVPGGENMLACSSGELRYFTVRESARLQTFPDDYVFCASWTESMRQLGNAVPVTLGHVIASRVKQSLESLDQADVRMAS